MNTKNQPESGFAMLEVLIAALVISFGLLGLAGLQATGLRNNHSAYLASVATQLTYDMADRIRANVSANYSTASAVNRAGCLTGCSTQNIAEDDLLRWNQSVAEALPGGIAAQPTLSNGLYTLSVTWNDARSNNPTTSFQTTFQP